MGLYDTLVGNSIIPDLINGIVDWFKSLPGKVLAFVNDLVVRMVLKALELKDKFVAKVSELVGSTVSWLSGLPGKAVAALGNIVATLVGKGNALITGFWNGAKTMWTNVAGWFRDLPGLILSTLGDLGRLLYNAGNNVIQGFIDGIRAMIGKVKSAVQTVARTVSDFLGFQSPTKEGPGRYSDRWGPNLMKMYAAGIEDTIPRLQSAVTRAASSVASGMGSAQSSGDTITKNLLGGIVIHATDGQDAADQFLAELRRRGVRFSG